MGVFNFVKNGVREMMIARPDHLKPLLCFKHPDQNFPMYSQLTVDSDEVAVFFKDGRVVGVLPPGRHTLHTQNIPFLNSIVTAYTGGQVFISELFFVRMTPKRNIPYGDELGPMIDAYTGVTVTPRVYGEFSLVVVDPVRFVIGYHGQSGYDDADNDTWVKKLFMIGIRQTLGDLCETEQVSLLMMASRTQKMIDAMMQKAPDLAEMGVRIQQMGMPHINFSDDDKARLTAAADELGAADREVKKKQKMIAGARADAEAKQYEIDQKFQQDARYVQQLAGNYQNYAAGQAVMGAGQGMAAHGVGGGIAGLGAQAAIGMSMGSAMAGGFAQGVPGTGAQPQFAVGGAGAAPQGGSMVVCSKCAFHQPSGKFCSECGTVLSQPKKFCTSCGGELLATAKFCSTCGTSAVVPSPASPGG